MKTKAVRMYGANDLRLEEFELPANQNIRIITVPITYAFDGEKDSVENPQWNCACPEHLANMAGTSYFFAKKLQRFLVLFKKTLQNRRL